MEIKRNEILVHNKKDLYNDNYLNQLADFIVENHTSLGLLNFVRLLFYIENIKDYDLEFNNAKIRFKNNIEEFNIIYNIFRNWIPFEKYNLSDCRGVFFEYLSFKLAKKNFNEYDIFTESKIILGDFQSYTIDIIIKLDNNLKCGECKFSANSLERKHLNQMVGLIKKLESVNLFLMFFDFMDSIEDKIYNLRGNTKSDVYDNLINNFTIFSLEDLINDNFTF